LDTQRLDVEAIFDQAVPMNPAQRLTFLGATCPDRKVRARVAALLQAHDNAGDFLNGPAVQFTPPSGLRPPGVHADTAWLPWSASGYGTDVITLDFLAPCDTPARLGVLAHYEILEILGRGGMGLVLRGVDVKLNRPVAIKVLAPQLAANAVARQRFQREAQAAAAVSHPHVVNIHAVDEWNGLPYLVMEYVSGLSLQQRIDGTGALPLAPLLRIGTQIAAGLAAAHAQGLVHRDIKPANILLENGIERVKITDFGLARAIDDVTMTQAGAVYGTPLYMSPEQARGERVDQRSDLFSLGSVLYAMSTGRPPFRGATSLAVLNRVCEDSPRPLREVNPAVPEEVANVVHKLLAKDPADRFQTANEVAELLSQQLANLQHDPLVSSHRESPPHIQGAERFLKPSADRKQLLEFPRGSRLRRPLLLGVAVFLLGSAVLAALEGARLTSWTGLASPRTAAIPMTEPAVAAPVKWTPGTADRPVKVFILAGDSHMAGRAKVTLLKFQANQAETKQPFRHLLHDGDWLVREDVWIKNFHQKGNLTVGFGQSPDRFGPELEFGQVVGDHFDEQVLLIKTCWGGHDLCRDFRSPSAGLPPPEILEKMRQELQKAKPDVTRADVERMYGGTYRAMIAEIRETLANLGSHFPSYQGQGFELAGVVWLHGWSDMVTANPFYTEHLAHLIRDLRTEFKTPRLPFVIGQLGVNGGSVPGTNDANFRTAQAAVAEMPEFVGNVKVVATDPFWDQAAAAVYKKGWQKHQAEWEKVGSDAPYQYLGSAWTFCKMGKAFGEAMIELRRTCNKD